MQIFIIYLTFLWAVFSGIFTLRGVQYQNPNIFIGSIHYILGVLIILYFIDCLSNKKIDLTEVNEKKYLFTFIIISVLSTILNISSILDSIKFLLTLVPPILIFIILVYDKSIHKKQVKNAFNLFIIICIIQFMIALFNNFNKIMDGVIIIDDYFRGTMGAYQFVFLINLYTIYLVNKYIITKKLNFFEVVIIIVFPISFIISGAGGYLFVFVLSLVLNVFFLSFKYNIIHKTKVLIPILVLIPFFYFLINYLILNYTLTEFIISQFIINDNTFVVLNNPKVAITLSALKPFVDFKSIMFGLGPGQYLSGIGGNPEAAFYGGILLDKMGSSAYAVNSDLFSIFSEVGLIGSLVFYLIIISTLSVKKRTNYISVKALLMQGTLSGTLIYALVLSIQYRSFMFFVPSYILWFFAGIIKRRFMTEYLIPIQNN